MTFHCLFCRRKFTDDQVKDRGHGYRCPKCGARFYESARRGSAFMRTGKTSSELKDAR